MPAIDPVQWRDSRVYLRGLDLFNEGFYWESHVEFESLWLAAGRKGRGCRLSEGSDSSGGRWREASLEGSLAGVVSHADRAAQLFEGLQVQLTRTEPLPFGMSSLILHDMAMSVKVNGWPPTRPKLLPL